MVPKSELLDSHSCALIESFLIGAKFDRYNNAVENSLKRHKDIEKDESAGDDQKKYSSRVIQISTSFDEFRNSISLDSLKQRIEMVKSFNFNS
jgi:hypothetical protein